MEEHAWYARQYAQLEEALWRLKQRNKRLQNYRRSLGAIWQDDAATEINRRYYIPHEDDSAEAITALQQQQKSLAASGTELEAARKHGLAITRMLDSIEEQLQFAQQDIKISHNEYEYYQEKNSIATAELPTIKNLIQQTRKLG